MYNTAKLQSLYCHIVSLVCFAQGSLPAQLKKETLAWFLDHNWIKIVPQGPTVQRPDCVGPNCPLFQGRPLGTGAQLPYFQLRQQLCTLSMSVAQWVEVSKLRSFEGCVLVKAGLLGRWS